MNPLSLMRNVTEGLHPQRPTASTGSSPEGFESALAQARSLIRETDSALDAEQATLPLLDVEELQLPDDLGEEAIAFLNEHFPNQELTPEALGALQASGLLPPPSSPGLKDLAQQPADWRYNALNTAEQPLTDPNQALPTPQRNTPAADWTQITDTSSNPGAPTARGIDGIVTQPAPLAAGVAEATGKGVPAHQGALSAAEPLAQSIEKGLPVETSPANAVRQALKQPERAPDSALPVTDTMAQTTAITASPGAADPGIAAPANTPATPVAPLTTTAATPAPGTSLIMQNAQLESQAWQDELGEHMVRLARMGDQRVSMQLNPAELGPVTVDLKMADKQVHLQLLSGNTVVRQALEAALPQLRDSLAEQGMSLGDAQVGEHTSFAQEQHAQRRPSDSGAGTYTDDTAVEPLVVSAPANTPLAGRVDTYV